MMMIIPVAILLLLVPAFLRHPNPSLLLVIAVVAMFIGPLRGLIFNKFTLFLIAGFIAFMFLMPMYQTGTNSTRAIFWWMYP